MMYRFTARPDWLVAFAAFAFCLALLAFAPVAAAYAQAPDTPVSSEGAVAPAGAQGAASAEASPSFRGVETAPLAERGQPPRTLRAYWHVFIAFAITWLLLFGYALSLGRRWAALERQLHLDGAARE